MMNINITEIVNDKIEKLKEEDVIEKAITDTFEKSIVKAVTDALDSYELKRNIEKKVTEQVSKVVADLDFQCYNSFMVEKMSQILRETCREDICEKIEKTFKDMFLCQTTEIKLSSIFEKFRKIAYEDVEESEKWKMVDWHCKLEQSNYGWLECELDYEDKDHTYRSDSAISFTVHRNWDDKTIGTIGSLYIDGQGIEKKFKFGHLNDVELLLVQAAMNEIPIIIDVEDVSDIDTSFDVDY